MAFRYHVYGFSIASGFPLALKQHSNDGPPEIHIDRTDLDFFIDILEQSKPVKIDDWYDFALLPDGAIYLRWHGLFEFTISADGSLIKCGWADSVSFESFEAYLLTFALSYALLRKKEEPLHATSVRIGKHGHAFFGPSGAGKSTLASFLINNGATLITDDILCVSLSNNCAIAAPGPMRIKLFSQTLSHLELSWEDRGAMNPFSRKMILTPPEGHCVEDDTQLAALYFLDAPDPMRCTDGVTLTPLKTLDCFHRLLLSTYNQRVSEPERLERQFRFAERLAKTVPAFSLSYPRDFAFFSSVREVICDTGDQQKCAS